MVLIPVSTERAWEVRARPRRTQGQQDRRREGPSRPEGLSRRDPSESGAQTGTHTTNKELMQLLNNRNF